MRRGVVHQHILEATPAPGSSDASGGAEGQNYEEHNATTISAYYRSWYASETDNVIRGRVSSRSNIQGLGQADPGVRSGRGETGGGRLNVMISMHREPSYPDASPLFRSSFKRIDDMTLLNRLLDPLSSPHSSTHTIAYSLQLSLTSSPTISLPATVSCGYIICHFPSPVHSHSGSDSAADLKEPNSYIVMIGSDQAVVCNGASDIDIVLSIEIDNPSSYKHTNYTSSSSDSKNRVSRLSNQCKRTLQSISQFSFAELEARHSTLFEERMSRTSLDLSSYPSSPVSSLSDTGRHASRGTETVSAECKAKHDVLLKFKRPYSPLSTQYILADIANICFDPLPSSPPHESHDALLSSSNLQLMSQMYQYGRYLLFSAGSRAAMNLQGLWADGKPGLFIHSTTVSILHCITLYIYILYT